MVFFYLFGSGGTGLWLSLIHILPIAFVLSRYTGIHVLVIYACVQLADLIKCVIGFVLVKKGVWLQNIVSS